jgi:peptidoglycan-associated lipoprotein
MLLRNGLCLLSALLFAGCASKQPALDAQRTAQQALESRLARLEAEQSAQTARLDQVALDSAKLKGQLDAMNKELASHQTSLSDLSGKIDNQMAQTATLSDKIDKQATQTAALSDKLDKQAAEIAQTKETADDAIKIARDSRLVSGKVIDSLLLTDDMVLYNYEQPELTAKGRTALDELIKKAVPQLPYIFIEIIGYSDDMSLGSQNRRIALERAESVRRYLFEVGGIPLHRMSVISYGDLKPIASNETIAGRNRNRRVMVEVLK